MTMETRARFEVDIGDSGGFLEDKLYIIDDLYDWSNIKEAKKFFRFVSRQK